MTTPHETADFCRGSGTGSAHEAGACPAIQSFKTAEAENVRSRLRDLSGFGAMSFIGGAAFAGTLLLLLKLFDDGVSVGLCYLMLIFGGATFFFIEGARNGLNDLRDRIRSDMRDMTGLKICAKRLQDKNIALSLRASMAAEQEGEAAGDSGGSNSSPAATIVSIPHKGRVRS